MKDVSSNVGLYYRILNELSVKDNFVFRGTRLVVPIPLCTTLVTLAHESHQGVIHTKQRLRNLVAEDGHAGPNCSLLLPAEQ